MPPSNYQHLVEQIHASATPLVLAVTGGGSGALAELLQVPGASATVLAAVVPYSPAALRNWLGGEPDQACSERTARAMAMAAFERARAFSDAGPRTLRGIGATASLTTNRPKRGAHRIHVAWQSAEMTVVTTRELQKGARSRAEEEEIATSKVLEAVAEACGVVTDSREQGAGSREQEVKRREVRAPSEWSELLLGDRQSALIDQSEIRNPKSEILFPGAFNPLHAGHERMAAIASRRRGGPVTWELSIVNVDKPPLDFIEISDRLAGLAGRRVLISRAATFAEKAALAPGCTFVVGADTIERIGDVRYYGGDHTKRDAAISAITERGCRFLVFGRLLGRRFCTLCDLNLPTALRDLCEEVPANEYREDAASSTMRANMRSASEDDPQ
jgi:nicotinamide mononucleotide (NMN) deamidase PncC